jgi:hypothetical protein
VVGVASPPTRAATVRAVIGIATAASRVIGLL